jgi:hypothetical protein
MNHIDIVKLAARMILSRRTSEEELAVIRSMACRWSDQNIAASLNRMGMRIGQRLTWNAPRISSLRREHGIHAYRSAEKNSEWLTKSEAAKLLGVTNHAIRRLINERILPAQPVVPDAPDQIRASDIHSEAVTAIACKHRPCRVDADGPTSNVYQHFSRRGTVNATWPSDAVIICSPARTQTASAPPSSMV